MACRSQYNHNNANVGQAGRRAKEDGFGDYSSKFEQLDSQFANGIADNGDENLLGPFEAAQGRFYPGQKTLLSLPYHIITLQLVGLMLMKL
jgi:hypothetical protein